jgi:hypothetical protein
MVEKYQIVYLKQKTMLKIFGKRWDCISRLYDLELQVENLKKDNNDLKDLVLDLTLEIAQLSVQVKHVIELTEQNKAL